MWRWRRLSLLLHRAGPLHALAAASRYHLATHLRSLVAEKPPEEFLSAAVSLLHMEAAGRAVWLDEWSPREALEAHGFQFLVGADRVNGVQQDSAILTVAVQRGPDSVAISRPRSAAQLAALQRAIGEHFERIGITNSLVCARGWTGTRARNSIMRLTRCP